MRNFSFGSCEFLCFLKRRSGVPFNSYQNLGNVLGGVLFFYKDTVYSLVFDKRQYLQYTAEIIGVALFLYSFFTTALSNGAAWYISTSLLTVIGTSLVILAHNEHSLLDFRPLTSLGKFSYFLYLWHWPVTIFCFDLGYSSKYIHLFSVIVLVAVFTALSYLYIEKDR